MIKVGLVSENRGLSVENRWSSVGEEKNHFDLRDPILANTHL